VPQVDDSSAVFDLKFLIELAANPAGNFLFGGAGPQSAVDAAELTVAPL
jgi:hypothetical protein